jgi:hypothetical protein
MSLIVTVLKSCRAKSSRAVRISLSAEYSASRLDRRDGFAAARALLIEVQFLQWAQTSRCQWWLPITEATSGRHQNTDVASV